MNKPEFLTTSNNPFAERYGNFIGGKWVAPRSGKYFDNTSPVNGQVLCEIARSDAADVEAALDAAHAAKDAWGRTSVGRARHHPQQDRRPDGRQSRSAGAGRNLGQRQADPRNDRAADLPLAIDHFRYFAGVIRAQEGRHLRNRSRHGRLSFPRAARRRRPDHSVELPAPDGVLETGAGTGGRQLRRAEAGRTDAGLHPGAGSN